MNYISFNYIKFNYITFNMVNLKSHITSKAIFQCVSLAFYVWVLFLLVSVFYIDLQKKGDVSLTRYSPCNGACWANSLNYSQFHIEKDFIYSTIVYYSTRVYAVWNQGWSSWLLPWHPALRFREDGLTLRPVHMSIFSIKCVPHVTMICNPNIPICLFQ